MNLQQVFDRKIEKITFPGLGGNVWYKIDYNPRRFGQITRNSECRCHGEVALSMYREVMLCKEIEEYKPKPKKEAITQYRYTYQYRLNVDPEQHILTSLWTTEPWNLLRGRLSPCDLRHTEERKITIPVLEAKNG